MSRSADHIDDQIAQSHIDLDERIRQRAHELYQARGGRDGNDMEDWLQAEREILGGQSNDSPQDRATVVGHAGRPGIVL